MRRPPATAAALMVFGLPFVVGSLATNHDDLGPGLVLLVVVILGALVVMVTNPERAPLGLFAIGLVTGTFFGRGYADGPVFLAVPVGALVLAWLGRESVRRLFWWCVLAVVVSWPGLEDGHGLVAGGSDRIGALPAVLITGALTAAGAAVGHTLATRRRELQAVAGRIVSEEQLRVARDLHDGVGHGLAVIAMQAGVALHVMDTDPGAARRSLEAIRDQSRESLDSLRGELARLSGGDAPRRPVPGLADLTALVERVRGGGLDVDLRLDLDPADAADEVSHAVYAITQEALTNVLRHADATHAQVVVGGEHGDVVVTITDDGRGTVGSSEGSGIAGMRARAAAVGGTVLAGPTGSGFRVRATLPAAVRV